MRIFKRTTASLWLFLIASLYAIASAEDPADSYWDGAIAETNVIRGHFYAKAADSTDLYTVLSSAPDLDPHVTLQEFFKWDGVKWSALVSARFRSEFGQSLVRSLAACGNRLYVGGRFSEVDGVSAHNIAQWDGEKWVALGEGVSGNEELPDVVTMAIAGPNLYAGGLFERAGDVEARRIAKWDGVRWSSLDGGVRLDLCSGCRDLARVWTILTQGEDVYVAGQFTRAGGVEVNNVARWNGSAWTWLGEPWEPGVFRGLKMERSRVTVAAQGFDIAFMGTNLFVSGQFSYAGFTAATNLARWDGSHWHPLQPGLRRNDLIECLASDGRSLYVGGGFTNLAGVKVNGIARWDGDSWHPLGSGINANGSPGTVHGIVSDGVRLLVSGLFTTAGTGPSTNLALWHIPRILEARRTENALSLSWPTADTNLALESSSSIENPDWVIVPQRSTLRNNRLTIDQDLSTGRRFYRLRQQE